MSRHGNDDIAMIEIVASKRGIHEQVERQRLLQYIERIIGFRPSVATPGHWRLILEVNNSRSPGMSPELIERFRQLDLMTSAGKIAPRQAPKGRVPAGPSPWPDLPRRRAG